MQAAARTGGVVIVDYHPRGMNEDFFPRYGPWLSRFAADHMAEVDFRTPFEMVQAFEAREAALSEASTDRLGDHAS